MSWQNRLSRSQSKPALAVDPVKFHEAWDEHSFLTDMKSHFAAIHEYVHELKAPPGWQEIPAETHLIFGGRAFTGRGLVSLITVDRIRNPQGAEEEWVHISTSRKSRMPDYEDLIMVRGYFLKEDKPCYQVFPKKDEHRNLHNYCLHLWMPLGADPFPDVFGDRAEMVAP